MRFFILLLFFTAFSCNPLRHYEGVATDTNVTPQKKAVIAPWVATYFDPGEPTVITSKDSVVEKIVVDSAKVDSLSKQLDALRNNPSIDVDSLKAVIMEQCVPKTVLKHVYHNTTIEKPSSAQQAKIYALQNENQGITADNTVLRKDNKTLKDEASEAKKASRTRLFLLIGAIVVILGLLYLLFKPKITI